MSQKHRIVGCCRVSARETDIFRLWILHYSPHVSQLAAVIVAEDGDDSQGLVELCREFGVFFHVCQSERFNPGSSMRALERVVKAIEADWIIHADSDEFLFEVSEIAEIVAEMEEFRFDHAIAWMADRLAVGGRLAAIEGVSSVAELEAAFPVRAAVTEGLAHACAYKVCVCQWPFLGSIHHGGGNLRRKCHRRLTLEHFKWRIGLVERLRKRIRDHAASRLPWGRESERILQELDRYGRIRAERWLAPRSRRIHGWMNYEHLYMEVVRRAPNHGHLVEVGVWQGRSLCFLAEASLAIGKRFRIDGVDCFRNFPQKKKGYPERLRALVTEHSWIDLAARNLRQQGMLDFVNLIQIPSPEAARLYEPASLDFVWLDGDHGYKSVLADLLAWWPKIKNGGSLAGHDLDQPQIQRALTDACLNGAQVDRRGHAFVATKQLPLPSNIAGNLGRT